MKTKLVTWICRKLGIARVHELEIVERDLAGDIGQLETLTQDHEGRLDDLVESLKNAEGDIEDLQKENRDLEESVEHHTGQIRDLEKGVEGLNEFRDNFDRVEIDESASEIANIKQWIGETNETLGAVRNLLESHGVVFDGESLTWRKSRGEKLGQICEALEVPSKELEDVLGESKSRILLEYRLEKLEEFQAELSRVFRLPDSK